MIEVEQDMTEGRAWTRTELDAYLNDRYVTFDGLADGTGLDGETLERLIETGCMPGPSYELRHRDELYAYINGDVNTKEFGISPSSVVKWSQRLRATGSVAPGQMGGHRPRLRGRTG